MANSYGPQIITNGLTICLDAANTKSYSGSGTTWYDLAGSYNGTFVNAPTYSSLNGGNFLFDGVDDYITVTDPGSLGNFTVDCWCNSTQLLGGGNYASVVASTYPNYVNFKIGYSSSNVTGEIDGGIFTGSAWVTTPATPILVNTWYNFHLTYNGSQLILYKNAIAAGTTNTTVTAQSSNINIRIGRRWDAANYWKGYIPIVRIYNRALSSTEISQNYNATKGRYGI